MMSKQLIDAFKGVKTFRFSKNFACVLNGWSLRADLSFRTIRQVLSYLITPNPKCQLVCLLSLKSICKLTIKIICLFFLEIQLVNKYYHSISKGFYSQTRHNYLKCLFWFWSTFTFPFWVNCYTIEFGGWPSGSSGNLPKFRYGISDNAWSYSPRK